MPEVGLEPTRPCGQWILNPNGIVSQVSVDLQLSDLAELTNCDRYYWSKQIIHLPDSLPAVRAFVQRWCQAPTAIVPYLRLQFTYEVSEWDVKEAIRSWDPLTGTFLD